MRSTKVSKFLDEKLRPYSAQSNIRALPFIGDGLKEVQRKALWGIFERGENRPSDSVERIAAYACSVTDYHHGAVSMQDAIANMAQQFAGRNNLPFLADDGQFGSRKDFKASQARYIKTKLDENFRRVFLKEDDCITERLHNVDMEIEPKFFIPAIPLILCNGADGIGTGHATEILPYNPKDIISSILRILSGDVPEKHTLVPWFGHDFIGKIEKDPATGQVKTTGVWEFFKKSRSYYLRITELPVSTQGDVYKKFLDGLEQTGTILDYDNLSDKNGFEFIIKIDQSVMDWPVAKLVKTFKLDAKTTENFTVWNPDGKVVRYECAEDLLIDWVAWRLDQYTKRFAAQLVNLRADLEWAKEKQQWIRLYLQDPLFFRDNETKIILEFMKANGLIRTDDLLSIPIRSLTKSKIDELEHQISKIKQEIAKVEQLDEVSVMISDIKLINKGLK